MRNVDKCSGFFETTISIVDDDSAATIARRLRRLNRNIKRSLIDPFARFSVLTQFRGFIFESSLWDSAFCCIPRGNFLPKNLWREFKVEFYSLYNCNSRDDFDMNDISNSHLFCFYLQATGVGDPRLNLLTATRFSLLAYPC